MLGRVKATLGLGANLGDPAKNLADAIARLAAAPGLTLTAVSSIYRSAPIGPPGQPDYLNAVVEIETEMSARALLEIVKQIEADLGREPAPRWSARPIDIDILTFGGLFLMAPGLVIPHPRLAERRFVLAPLAEIAPELVVPGLNRTAKSLYERLGEDPKDTVKIAPPPEVRR